ncbi:TMEM143 family protein [Kamptonema sp. UHCC 0994]|uniref:TMEM143 family protein n=1 Tax=Kamptonema sp. UHCC 0994 TaxID=3031329 RepID=UPI0023B8CC7F|nr:TMEM143 family protein [Kamptonema sp. UHCC 0994]MDF0553099.1 TMEM143 family protein [Kamptonema sp. UHCC 0994]
MAVYKDREAFIPYRRSDLIELCVEDGQLAPTEIAKFRDFCEILSAYYHFQLHQTLEVLKDNFVPFNPDADTKLRIEPNSAQQTEMEAKLISAFKTILERANYVILSEEMLQQALNENSLLELNTKVDFEDFEQIVCYYRGDTQKTASVKKLLKQVEKTVDTFDRVVLLLKFKDAAYFAAKKSKPEKLNFTPGKIYIYFYKNIPKFDLEFLFPNIKISMTWKDRLLLGVPAIGAGASVIIKVLPQLLLIIGVILFVFFGKTNFLNFNISKENVENILPVLVAALSMVVALGGVGFRQYNNYNYKKVKFQKNVTDTLFFRNLANNASVFGALIDAAEEEECKEIILAYYHLMTSKKPLTPEQLDDRIEVWMENKFGTKIDFDIQGPLGNLEGIRGKIIKDGGDEANTPELTMLTYDAQGCCIVPSLDDAKTVIDYLWDNAFLYAK